MIVWVEGTLSAPCFREEQLSHIALKCTRCAALHGADMRTLRCRRCESLLEVEYRGDASGPQPAGWQGPAMPLPMHGPDAVVSLGEGDTPCVRLSSLGRALGLDNLYAKLEFVNPTGSFKDRGTAVMMSVAREHGIGEIVEDSSGNAGASTAAYAARAGIRAHVFAPASAPGPKIRQIAVYGAEVHSIDGPREAAAEAAIRFYTERGLVYASHNLSPYYVEGTKSFAYELLRQLPEIAHGHVVVPVGNGSLYMGAWKGFDELRRTGKTPDTPRLHCIQATAAMPIAAAFGGLEWSPVPGVTTVAGGISAVDPARKAMVLDTLRRTGGVALAVEDRDTLRWQRLLAEREGIYAEPTSAAAFAGVEKLVGQGHVDAADPVVVPVTGSGLKDSPAS